MPILQEPRPLLFVRPPWSRSFASSTEMSAELDPAHHLLQWFWLRRVPFPRIARQASSIFVTLDLGQCGVRTTSWCWCSCSLVYSSRVKVCQRCPEFKKTSVSFDRLTFSTAVLILFACCILLLFMMDLLNLDPTKCTPLFFQPILILRIWDSICSIFLSTPGQFLKFWSFVRFVFFMVAFPLCTVSYQVLCLFPIVYFCDEYIGCVQPFLCWGLRFYILFYLCLWSFFRAKVGCVLNMLDSSDCCRIWVNGVGNRLHIVLKHHLQCAVMDYKDRELETQEGFRWTRLDKNKALISIASITSLHPKLQTCKGQEMMIIWKPSELRSLTKTHEEVKLDTRSQGFQAA